MTEADALGMEGRTRPYVERINFCGKIYFKFLKKQTQKGD
jgi:hypothetical protein